MKRRAVLGTVGSVGLVAAAGCLGRAAKDEPTATPTTAGTVLAVTAVPEDEAATAPPSTKAHFDGLTGAQQEEFRGALDRDVADPTAWSSGTALEYVNYEGTWYAVQVHIVN